MTDQFNLVQHCILFSPCLYFEQVVIKDYEKQAEFQPRSFAKLIDNRGLNRQIYITVKSIPVQVVSCALSFL